MSEYGFNEFRASRTQDGRTVIDYSPLTRCPRCSTDMQHAKHIADDDELSPVQHAALDHICTIADTVEGYVTTMRHVVACMCCGWASTDYAAQVCVDVGEQTYEREYVLGVVP